MASRNYLVEGLSGAGKSSVYEELVERGYRAISTDRAWKDRAVTASWDEARALAELERPDPDVLFVCGSSRNRDRFLPFFTMVFNLRIDDETMRRRLLERTNNDYGKAAEELELMLTLNRRGERPAGAIDIDAAQPLDRVVAEVLRLAGCSPRNDAPRPPWANRDHVLATLVPYLEEQRVPLDPARLDPAAFDGAELRRHYERVHGTTADGVEYALLDGIAYLRDTVTPDDRGS